MEPSAAGGLVEQFSIDQLGPREFRLAGELDLSTSPQLHEVVDAGLAEGWAGDVTLDLAGLQFIDSTGLHAIVKLAIALGEGGRILLRAPTKSVRKVFDLVGLEVAGNIEVSDG